MKIINILYNEHTKQYYINQFKDPYKNQAQTNKFGLLSILNLLKNKEHKKYQFKIDEKILEEAQSELVEIINKEFPKSEVVLTKF